MAHFRVYGYGGIAQLVERLLCKQDVSGSSPLTSTNRISKSSKYQHLEIRVIGL